MYHVPIMMPGATEAWAWFDPWRPTTLRGAGGQMRATDIPTGRSSDDEEPAYEQVTAHVRGRDVPLVVYAKGDVVSTYIKKHHIWHPAISNFLSDLLKVGDTFVDVGAHIGYFSVLASTLVGSKGRVIAFEPDRRNFAMLTRNRSACEAPVTATCVAVAERSDTARLLHPSRQPGHSRLVSEDCPGATPVSTVSLSEALAHAGPIQCIKIDVQGSERAVLDGLKDLLRTFKAGWQPFIIVEIAPTAWLAHDPDLTWLKSFLHDNSYDVHLFLGSESLKVAPLRLGWETLAALIRDSAAFNHSSKELDLFLAPVGYWSWLLKRYARQTPDGDK